jgi:Zn-dependent oligopeptidase
MPGINQEVYDNDVKTIHRAGELIKAVRAGIRSNRQLSGMAPNYAKFRAENLIEYISMIKSALHSCDSLMQSINDVEKYKKLLTVKANIRAAVSEFESEVKVLKSYYR